MTLAEEIANDVDRLFSDLRDDGLSQEYTITKKISGVYDPDTGETPVTESTQIVLGSDFDSFSQSGTPSSSLNIDSGLIKAGDRRILLSSKDTSGVSVDIKADYLISDSTNEYTIVLAGKTDPGGIVINHDLIIRG